MLVRAVRKRTPRSRSSRASCVIASWPPSHLLVHLPVCAKQRALGLPKPRRRAWSRRRRARSGGVSHTSEREIPPSLSKPPFPRPSPQGIPAALPYLILRRLSSTSDSRAAARQSWRGRLLSEEASRRQAHVSCDPTEYTLRSLTVLLGLVG